MKHLIAFISILMLASVVSGTATSITIYGTNRSNADSNVTCYGCNNTIEVQAWNTTYVKNWTVALNNASDSISFNISNVTAYQVQELKVNGTSVDAYQAGANGMLNFTYTQTTGNKTYVLAPARKIDGYNFTWGRIWQFGNIGIAYPGNVNSSKYIGVQGSDTPWLGGSAVWSGIEIQTESDVPSTTHDAWLHFVTSDSGVIGGARRMTIDRSGNVGIGTTLPNATLRVVGNVSISSNLRVNGFNISAISSQTVNRSYVKSTVYQNTNTTPMFMTVTAYASGAGTTGCNYKTGTTNPPTDFVGSQAEANADMQSFWVLPDYYFAAFQSAGTCTILSWSVWQ